MKNRRPFRLLTLFLALTLCFAGTPSLRTEAADTPAYLSLIAVGDCVNMAYNHVALITDIVRDSKGNITFIEVCENTPPIAIRRFLTPAKFAARFGGYTLLRYKDRDSVSAPSPYAPVSMPRASEDSWGAQQYETGTALTNASLSTGVKNIVRRAYQQVEIEWVPLADVAGFTYSDGSSSGVFKAGVKYHGIPYGQNVNSGFYVPHNRGFEVFLSAVVSADSSFYTARGSYGSKTAPFFAGDCSSFVSYCYGLNRMTTATISYSNRFTTLCYVASSSESGQAVSSSSVSSSGSTRSTTSSSSSSQKSSAAKTTMTRLYNSKTHEHLYTKDANEISVLTSAWGWEKEGDAWKAPSKSNTPVWRLFSSAGEHFYTTDAYERGQLIATGSWQDEGIGWYSDDAKGVPVYRLYNAKAGLGAHHYTSDAYERSVLVGQGWADEGIAWYGVK